MKNCKALIVLTLFLLTPSSWAQEVGCDEVKSEVAEEVYNFSLSLRRASPFGYNSCYRSSAYNLEMDTGFVVTLDTFAEIFPNRNHVSSPTDFEAQADFCRCILEQKKEEDQQLNLDFDFGLDSSPDEVLKSDDFALAHLDKLLDNFNKRAQNTHNMLILHAQSMGPETAVRYNLDQPVSLDEKFTSFVNRTIKSNVKKDVRYFNLPQEQFDYTIENLIAAKAMEDKGPAILNVLQDGEVEGESCVPMKDFLLINSFPENNTFWHLFTEDFYPHQWKSDDLALNYTVSITDKDKEIHASKIEFLEKNPLIKLIFNSDDQEAAKKVYNIMRKHMSGLKGECSSGATDGCRTEFTRKRMSAYHNEMKNLFNTPEIQRLVSRQRHKAVKDYIEKLISDTSQKLDINTLNHWAANKFKVDVPSCTAANNIGYSPGYSTDFSQIKLDLNYSYRDAFKETCERELPRYCELVGKGSNSLLSMGATAGYTRQEKANLDDLLNRIADDMNPDPSKNMSYSTFSHRVCNGHFRIHDSKSVNFNEFRERRCGKNSGSELCKNKKELYRLFAKGEIDHQRNDDFDSSSAYADYSNTGAEVQNLSNEDRNRFEKVGGSLGQALGMSHSHEKNNFELNDIMGIKELGIVDVQDSVDTGIEAFNDTTSSFVSNYVNNAFQTDYNYALANARETKQELDEEIRATKEIIAVNKERLARPHTTQNFRSEIESKVKMLETMLAEREKTAQEYQEIIAKLIDGQNNAEPTPVSSSPQMLASQQMKSEGPQEDVRSAAPTRTATITSTGSKPEFSEDTSRAPASVEAFSTSGGAKGGGGALGSLGSTSFASGASSGRKGAINSALLSKYGITIQESDSSVQVAPDKERSQISQLLTNASKSDVGLEVSKVEFDKFKNYDVNALNELYQEKIEMLDSEVVKLMIHTEGEDESLEFYAIKEDGKVVFQPVRKNRLSDLQNALR